LLGTGSNDKAV